MKNYQSLPENFKFTRRRKTLNEKELEKFKREKDLAMGFFLKISERKKSEVIPPRALLKMDYIFCNQNVEHFLEKNESCEKYSIVYAFHSEYGVHRKILPEACIVDGQEKEKPTRMMNLLEELTLQQEKISHVAVLEEIHFKDKSVSTIYKLFVYHFDIERFEDEKQRQLKLGLVN